VVKEGEREKVRATDDDSPLYVVAQLASNSKGMNDPSRRRYFSHIGKRHGLLGLVHGSRQNFHTGRKTPERHISAKCDIGFHQTLM
jgi:hypothetical protein